MKYERLAILTGLLLLVASSHAQWYVETGLPHTFLKPATDMTYGRFGLYLNAGMQLNDANSMEKSFYQDRFPFRNSLGTGLGTGVNHTFTTTSSGFI